MLEGSNPSRADEQGDVIEHRSVRSRHHDERPGIGLNLTAMIDVTFLLLIYFMVATEFKVGEEVYRLDLPRSLQSNQASDPFELDEQPLVIEVTSTGAAGRFYRLHIEGPYRDPDTFDDLYDFLRSSQISDDATGGRPMFFPDHPIVIRPSRSATWDHTISAFNAAARARYTNIKFGKPI